MEIYLLCMEFLTHRSTFVATYCMILSSSVLFLTIRSWKRVCQANSMLLAFAYIVTVRLNDCITLAKPILEPFSISWGKWVAMTRCRWFGIIVYRYMSKSGCNCGIASMH